MADYTRWWQYIVILTIVGFILFVVVEVYFMYVPIFRIEQQVYHTTDLLNEGGEAAIRIEKKIDATLRIIEPLILPIVIQICDAICGTEPTEECPTATFDYCKSIEPPTESTSRSIARGPVDISIEHLNTSGPVGVPIVSNTVPKGLTATNGFSLQYYQRS